MGIEDNEIAGEGDRSEQMVITAVSPDGLTMTLDSPLLYEHYSAIDTYGTDTIELRGEVGLLSRNVKFQGDLETS